MNWLLLVTAGLVTLWALAARPLARFRVTAPIMMVLAGAIAGYVMHSEVALSVLFNSDVAQIIAELILALLLFVDATEVDTQAMRQVRGPVVRLLFIALPVSLLLAVGAGFVLLGDLGFPTILALACIVVPTDFSPMTSIVREVSISQRVRHVMNIESGYNDGILSPIFVFALALAGNAHHGQPSAALTHAIPAALIAVASGIVLGASYAWASNVAGRRGWFSGQSMRVGLVGLPLSTFAVAVALGGNGFVAAFVAGTVFRIVRRTQRLHAELQLVDDISVVNNMGLWFILGGCVVFIASILDSAWEVGLYVALVLTVIRLVPVLIGLIGSRLPLSERMLIGLLGPRGTASVVFGLLAFNAISDDNQAYTVMAVTIVTLGTSMVLHGIGAPLIVHACTRPSDRVRWP